MKYTFSLFLIALTLITAPAFAQLQTINTIAGTSIEGYSGDGSFATAAELFSPRDVIADNAGNVYIVDFYNRRVREINTSGIIHTIAGTGVAGYTGDSTIATSAELSPNGIAMDKSGNIYISDANFSVIRRIDHTTGFITTIAGTPGMEGYAGDGGAAVYAKLNDPCGLAFDTSGNLYIADSWNNVIRMINTAGIITTIAGTDSAGYFGDDSLATQALLDSPYAVAVDTFGNIFISDNGNNVIRRIDTNQRMSTFAGVYNMHGFNPDSAVATSTYLNSPRGLAVDAFHNLYIADAGNNVIRKVDTFGYMSSVVGNGIAGFGGDLGTVNGCNLFNPYGVAVDKYGSIYIADANNERVRKTTTPDLAVKSAVAANVIAAYPNPFTGDISVSGLSSGDKAVVYDMAGKQVSEVFTAGNAGIQNVAAASLAAGIYMLQVMDGNGNKKAVVKLVKEQ